MNNPKRLGNEGTFQKRLQIDKTFVSIENLIFH